MRVHDSKQKTTVGCAQSAQRHAMLHRGIGKSPVAPCDEAREVGLEIPAAEDVSLDRVMVKEQHAPVPQRGLGPLQLTEVTGDIGAAFVGERPRPRRKRKLEPPDAYGSIMAAMQARPDLI
jgi:hypothetical protein